MSEKTNVDVTIGGKIFKFSGYETPEYYQRIGLYLNQKIDELNEKSKSVDKGLDTRSTIICVNIADEYFRAKDKLNEMEKTIEEQSKMIYELRQDIVNLELKLEESNKK